MPNTFPTTKHVADALEGTPEPVGLADALKWCDDLTRSDLAESDRSAITTVLAYLSELGKDARAMRAALKAQAAPNADPNVVAQIVDVMEDYIRTRGYTFHQTSADTLAMTEAVRDILGTRVPTVVRAGGGVTTERLRELRAECEQRRDEAQASANYHEGSGNDARWQGEADFFAAIRDIIDSAVPNVTDAMAEAAARVLVDEGEFTVGFWEDQGEKARADFLALARRALTAALTHAPASAPGGEPKVHEQEPNDTTRLDAIERWGLAYIADSTWTEEIVEVQRFEGCDDEECDGIDCQCPAQGWTITGPNDRGCYRFGEGTTLRDAVDEGLKIEAQIAGRAKESQHA